MPAEGNKGKNACLKPSPLVGEGVSGADRRGKREQKGKTIFYKATVNTCLPFSNEVMASELFFEERSDAVKECEMLCLG